MGYFLGLAKKDGWMDGWMNIILNVFLGVCIRLRASYCKGSLILSHLLGED